MKFSFLETVSIDNLVGKDIVLINSTRPKRGTIYTKDSGEYFFLYRKKTDSFEPEYIYREHLLEREFIPITSQIFFTQKSNLLKFAFNQNEPEFSEYDFFLSYYANNFSN